MKICDLLSMCLRSLLRRKVRTLLTVIGVVIGTCAIVVTISLGEGMTQSQMAMLSQWTDLTTIEVYPDYWSEQGASTNAPELTDDMLEVLKSTSMWTQCRPPWICITSWKSGAAI